MRIRIAAALLAPMALAAGLGQHADSAQAQPAWPTRAVTVVVPYPPGGNTDVMTRVVMEKVADRLGQPIVVENRPGAGGIVGSAHVSKAPADGYTWLVAIPGFALNQSLYKQLPFNPADLQPASLMTRTSLVLVTSNELPARDFGQLLAYGKKAAPPLNFGSSGSGSLAFILSQRFLNATGIDEAMHVPYKGSADAVADLISGRIGFMFDAVSAMGPHITSGKMNAMAVTGANRSPALPNTPTVKELGYPTLESYAWAGLLAPTGTPDAIIKRMAAEVSAAARQQDVVARLESLSSEAVGSTPDEFAKFLADEVAIGKDIITRTGVPLL